MGIKLDLIQDETSISSSHHLVDFTGNISTGESLEEYLSASFVLIPIFEVTLIFHIVIPSSDSTLCHA